jgi:hypothetical protein
MTEIQLNDRWRVILSDYDPPQWLLQRGTLTESWCQTRSALLTAINEKVVHATRFYPNRMSRDYPVEQTALDAVASLPVAANLAPRTVSAANVPSDSEIAGEKR